VPKELVKDAVIPMHSISPTLYVKGLTYQHILSVDMFTKEQVSDVVKFHFAPLLLEIEKSKPDSTGSKEEKLSALDLLPVHCS